MSTSRHPADSPYKFLRAYGEGDGDLFFGRERETRVLDMVEAMDRAGFGTCTNHRECEASCPKEISIAFITRLNRDFATAGFHNGTNGA